MEVLVVIYVRLEKLIVILKNRLFIRLFYTLSQYTRDRNYGGVKSRKIVGGSRNPPRVGEGIEPVD